MTNKFLLTTSRIITGIVFVFSGFVKGVDPLGTAYKLEEYFAAYGTSWANEYALMISILLCTLEFTIGAALLLNLRMKITAWALLLIMVFFTGLTFYDAIYAPVPDCGCFGDAIKMTNWQTFFKNVILMGFVIIVFKKRNIQITSKKLMVQNIWLFAIFIGFAYFSNYNYRHLPMIDFIHWKVGNNMVGDKKSETKVFVTYRNIQTNEMQEFLSPHFPWNDSVWMSQWEFAAQRFETNGHKIAHGLLAEDAQGNDFTNYILESDNLFVFVIYDLQKAHKNALQNLGNYRQIISNNGQSSVMLTGSLPEEISGLQKEILTDFEVFYADATVLKSMIRSNPGLVLFSKGTVVAKWHYNDFPTQAEIAKLLSKPHESKSN